MSYQQNKKGYTLIELLVVIAIIALLSTIAIVSINKAREKARDTVRITDIKQIRTALEMYLNENNSYVVQETAETLSNIGTSMTSIPKAPTPADDTCSESNNSYLYMSTNFDGSEKCTKKPCDGYMLQFCTGATINSIKRGFHCATQEGVFDRQCSFPNN